MIQVLACVSCLTCERVWLQQVIHAKLCMLRRLCAKDIVLAGTMWAALQELLRFYAPSDHQCVDEYDASPRLQATCLTGLVHGENMQTLVHIT